MVDHFAEDLVGRVLRRGRSRAVSVGLWWSALSNRLASPFGQPDITKTCRHGFRRVDRTRPAFLTSQAPYSTPPAARPRSGRDHAGLESGGVQQVGDEVLQPVGESSIVSRSVVGLVSLQAMSC